MKVKLLITISNKYPFQCDCMAFKASYQRNKVLRQGFQALQDQEDWKVSE